MLSMSAIHERRYRLQREREIAQNRVKATTENYLERYEQLLNNLQDQGLEEFVSVEMAEVRTAIRSARAYLSKDAFRARNISMQIGQEIYALPSMARELRNISVETQRFEQQEKQRRESEEKQQHQQNLQQMWQESLETWTDKLSRNLAMQELSTLKQRLFDSANNYTKQQLISELNHIKVQYEAKAEKKRQSIKDHSQQEATKKMVEELAEDIQQENLPDRQSAELKSQLQNAILDPNLSFSTLQSLMQETDKALIDESIRKEMVKAVYASLKQAGFSVLTPKLVKNDDEDVVIIQAHRPSGNQAKFKIQLDGKMRYEFDNYRGQTCQEDMKQVLPKLEEIYGVNLSEERVIWSNPDDKQQDMKPITPLNAKSGQ